MPVKATGNQMYSLVLESNDPFFNLAAEEYFLHERKENFVILSVNDPCVVIGKHQVAHREVNTKFAERNNIPVIRRISGGGTVYHDRGNLNFTFIRQSEQGKQVDFMLYTKPVIGYLQSRGINAILGEKNAITVNGLKISGNAEHVYRERVLHHGTLLFDTSLDFMRQAIRPAEDKYSTRGVGSNRTHVTNIKPLLGDFNSIDQLISDMTGWFRNTDPGALSFSLKREEVEEIDALAERKYRTWEWNWGYGPGYSLNCQVRSDSEEHKMKITVREGVITEISHSGSDEGKILAERLKGCRHMFSDIRNVIKSLNIAVSDDDIYDGFF